MEKMGGRGRKGGDLSSADLLQKWPQQPELDYSESRIWELLHVGVKQELGPQAH